MYVSSGFLATKWGIFNKSAISRLAPLTYIEAAQLSNYLEEDGRSVAYSSLVSVADAIRGVESGFHSWAIVKLYYSLFYTLRSFLCFDGHALFFSNGKPFKVRATGGAFPEPVGTSSSHKAVMQTFASNYSGSLLLSQLIGFRDPFEWMQLQRETVNYRQAKFVEPDTLTAFKGIMNARSIRQAISAYIDDSTLSFDEDHAIMAYPVLALNELKRFRPDIIDEEDQERLLAILVDGRGRISAFEKIIR